MAATTTNDLKRGMTLDLPEGLFQVVDFQRVEQAVVDKKEMQFLYHDGDHYVFMDSSTYEQLHVGAAALGDAVNYIVDGSTAVLQVYKDEIIGTDLPAAVELAVSNTDPGVQGDRVSAARPGAGARAVVRGRGQGHPDRRAAGAAAHRACRPCTRAGPGRRGSPRADRRAAGPPGGPEVVAGPARRRRPVHHAARVVRAAGGAGAVGRAGHQRGRPACAPVRHRRLTPVRQWRPVVGGLGGAPGVSRPR